MRWLGLLICFLSFQSFSIADELPARGYSQAWLGALQSGYGYAPESFSMFWMTASNSEQALAVGHMVASGASPISAGFAQLPISDKTCSAYSASLPGNDSLQTSYPALFAGNRPFKPLSYGLPANSTGNGTGAAPGSGMSTTGSSQRMSGSDGMPLITNTPSLVSPDEPGTAFSNPIASLPPASEPADTTNPFNVVDETTSPGVSLLTAREPVIGGSQMPNVPLSLQPGSSSISAVQTPEPATFGLSLIGFLALVIARWKKLQSPP
jgi:hypothetical protein